MAGGAMIPDLSKLRDKPKDHASYRVRPRALHPLMAKPIAFTADGDERARFIFRHARATLMAQGMPLMDLVLERKVPSAVPGREDATWVEVGSDA